MPNPLLPSGGKKRSAPEPAHRAVVGARRAWSCWRSARRISWRRPAGRSRTASSRGWCAAARSPKSPSATRIIRGKLKKAERPDRRSRRRASRIRSWSRSSIEHGVKYSGEVVSRWLPEILSWVVPFLLLVALWSFFFRRMGGAEGGVMSFARSKAKIYAEDDVKTTFQDVAGVDEAAQELREIVEFLKNPRKYTNLGGKIPEGRAAGRPAGHRQDAAGARGGRRSQGAVLQPERLGVRRDVRRRRRGARARSVLAGRSQGAVHRLHRRARRARQGPRRRARWAATRSASRRSISCSPRWTASIARKAIIIMARHQPARGARPGAAAPRPLRSAGAGRQARRQGPRRGAEDPRPQRQARARPSTCARSRRARPGLPAPISPTSSTRRRCWRRGATRPPVDMHDFDEAIDRLIAGLEKKRVMSTKEREIVAYHESGHAIVASVPAGHGSGAQDLDRRARLRRARLHDAAAARGSLPDAAARSA